MTNIYQDFDFITMVIATRLGGIECAECEEKLAHNAWNILRGINCQDATIFETIINGICNAFNLGYDEHKFIVHMWE